jgi:uncharacterized protein with PIN domain
VRVCEKHRERAVETWKVLKTDEEIDLCPQCLESVRTVLREKLPELEPIRTGRVGRPPKIA